jgi:hypothetical protein
MDTEMVSDALFHGYHYFKDRRYLKSALKAADWAKTFKCVPNWNYNAFSIKLLAQAYQETGNKEYLDACRKKLAVGLLPGQTETGRWIDGHNALIQYHMIIMRCLAETYPLLPRDDNYRRVIKKAVEKGVTPLIQKNSEMKISKPLDTLALLLQCIKNFGPNKKAEAAVQMNLSFIMESAPDTKKPSENIARVLMCYIYGI